MFLARSSHMTPPLRGSVPFFFFNDTATTEIYTLSLHDALPIFDETEGNTTNTRSRKIPTRPKIATTTSGACRWGGRPVRRLSRYTNGMIQPTTSTTHARVVHGCTKTR